MKKVYILSAVLLQAAIAFAEGGYTTSGNGTTYTFASLSEIEGSGVTKVADKTYNVSADLTLEGTDKLKIESGDIVKLADGVLVTVTGEAIFNPENRATITVDGEAKPVGFTLKGKTEMRNLDVTGGGNFFYQGDAALVVDNCNFSNINGVRSNYGVIVLSGYSKGSQVTNCTFTDCEPGAVNTPANLGVGLLIENNTMTNCSTLDKLCPYINVTAGGAEEVIVRNNTLNGARLEKPGGIGVSNMLNAAGDNKVLIEGNKVENCSWGINLVGGMNVRLINNFVKDNNADPDVNGGIAVTMYSMTTLPQTVYATGNTFQGNKWGPIAMGATTVNFGNLSATGDDYNPGMNIFIGNGHEDNGSYVACDFCNYNTGADAYAQGNVWNNATTEAEVAATIFDNNYSSAYGKVIYSPFRTTGVENINSDNNCTIDGGIITLAAPAMITVYNMAGVAVASAYTDALDTANLPAGIYAVRIDNGNGVKTAKFAK